MNDLKREYNEAMIDIEIYCKHLEELENQKNYSQLSKTMKGNLFLMLYNVIESIITKSLILIHNTINDEKIRVEECIDQIKDLMKSMSSINNKYLMVTMAGRYFEQMKHEKETEFKELFKYSKIWKENYSTMEYNEKNNIK